MLRLEDAFIALELDWHADFSKLAGPEDLAELGRTGLDQAGSDVWVAALVELGLAKRDNSNGTLEIECPWSSGHTADTEGTAYLGEGLFKCQHDHCSGRRSGDFKEELGTRLGLVGKSIMGLLAGMGSPSERAAEDDYVARKSIEHVFDPDPDAPPPPHRGGGLTFQTEAEAVGRLIYVSADGEFIDEVTGAILSKVEVDEALWPVAVELIKRGQKAVTNMILIRSDLRRVHHLVYRPGLGRLIVDQYQGGLPAYNTWQAPGLARRPAGQYLKVILDHIQGRLFQGDPDVADIWLDWSAALVQRPSEKCNWMPLVIGAGGTGKDLLFSLYRALVGGSNFYSVGSAGIMDRATLATAVKHKVILIEELLGAGSRVDMANLLKPLITVPPETITVRSNYKGPETVAKVANLVAYTNNVDALHIGTAEERRRYLIYQSKAVALTAAEATLLAEAVAKGAGEYLGFLLDRDLSKWNPFITPVTAATTKAGNRMMVASMSGSAQKVMEIVEEGALSGRNLVLSTELTQAMDNARVRADIGPHALREGMVAAGFAQWAEGKQITFDTERPRVWIRVAAVPKDIQDWAVPAMKAAVEVEQKASAEDRARGLFGANVVPLKKG